MLRQCLTKAALTGCILSVFAISVTVSAREGDQVLGELSAAIKVTGQAEKKRALLNEVAELRSMNALDTAIAAMADKDVGKEAFAAAGRIAQSLLEPGQPAYVRRSAFMRWVACQPEQQLAGTLIEALRSDDFVRQSGAVSTLNQKHSSELLKSVLAEMTSFPADSRENLLELLPAWGDTTPLPILLRIAGNAEREADRAHALQSIVALAPTAGSDADRALLLDALKLVTESAGKDTISDTSVAAAIQIAQALAGNKSDDMRKMLDKLAARNLSEAARQRVRGALLHFSINGLENLARGAKASSPDGFDTEGGSSGDAAAIDGNEGTYWDETDGHQLYKLRVDLPKASDVSAISISGWGHHSFSPKDFKVLCDGKAVATIAGATYVNNRLVVALPRTRCKSLELHITAYYGGSPAVRELGIYDAP